jgi:hypothetical protein
MPDAAALDAECRRALRRARACVDERNAYIAAHGHDDVSKSLLARLELLMLTVEQAYIDYGMAIGDKKMVEEARAMLKRNRERVFALHEIDLLCGKAGRGH